MWRSYRGKTGIKLGSVSPNTINIWTSFQTSTPQATATQIHTTRPRFYPKNLWNSACSPLECSCMRSYSCSLHCLSKGTSGPHFRNDTERLWIMMNMVNRCESYRMIWNLLRFITAVSKQSLLKLWNLGSSFSWQAMREKYLKGVFGTCPRVLCDRHGLRVVYFPDSLGNGKHREEIHYQFDAPSWAPESQLHHICMSRDQLKNIEERENGRKVGLIAIVSMASMASISHLIYLISMPDLSGWESCIYNLHLFQNMPNISPP